MNTRLCTHGARAALPPSIKCLRRPVAAFSMLRNGMEPSSPLCPSGRWKTDGIRGFSWLHCGIFPQIFISDSGDLKEIIGHCLFMHILCV
jgi:hypothetical protein